MRQKYRPGLRCRICNRIAKCLPKRLIYWMLIRVINENDGDETITVADAAMDYRRRLPR